MQLVVQAAQEVLHAQVLAGTKPTSSNVQYVRIFPNNMVGNKKRDKYQKIRNNFNNLKRSPK